MIDLHTHTVHSDGTDTVEEILKKAEEKGIEILSITDHDSVDAYFELESNPAIRKNFSGKLVIGSELKTAFEGVSIEVLAYGINYKTFKIDNKKALKNNQEIILDEFKKIADRLGFVYDNNNTYIDENDPARQYASFILGTELLKHEENKELILQIGEFKPESFFRVHQCNVNSPFYIDETKNVTEINELINRIHEAGGLAFLAHGYIYPYNNKDEMLEKIISTTKLDGMECIYTLFSEEERNKAQALWRKYNKYLSGGTDYHAKNKPDIDLGTGKNNNVNIDKSFVTEWIDKVRSI